VIARFQIQFSLTAVLLQDEELLREAESYGICTLAQKMMSFHQS